MSDIFNALKAIVDIIIAIFDFIAGAFKGLIQCGQAALSFLGLLDDAISAMPPIIIPFMFATIGVIIIYFIIGIITGGES